MLQVYSAFPRVERTVFLPRCERVDASRTPRTKNVNMITGACASSVFPMHRNDATRPSIYIARARARKVQRLQIEKLLHLEENDFMRRKLRCNLKENVNGGRGYEFYRCFNESRERLTKATLKREEATLKRETNCIT